jgi:16S rRNA (guanine966-N2)-methyltransferase
LRVIAGKKGGIPLKAVPGSGTRPTTDKVKEAIFSRITPYLRGGNVLDLFAGTGGLGIEALSRGMDQAIFIDKDRKSIETLNDNLRATEFVDQAEVYRNDYLRALKALSKRELKFALIFIDPPYKMKNAEEIMNLLESYGLLESEAVSVVEHDAAHTYADQVGTFYKEKESHYGDTAVTIYVHKMNDEE